MAIGSSALALGQTLQQAQLFSGNVIFWSQLGMSSPMSSLELPAQGSEELYIVYNTQLAILLVSGTRFWPLADGTARTDGLV